MSHYDVSQWRQDFAVKVVDYFAPLVPEATLSEFRYEHNLCLEALMGESVDTDEERHKLALMAVFLACLRLSCLHGRLDIIRFLHERYIIEENMTILQKSLLDCFHLVVRLGNVDIGRFYLENFSFNINQKGDSFPVLPLHACVAFQHEDFCRLLLEHGADRRAKDDTGNEPLHLACMKPSVKIVQMLVEDHHANVEAVNAVGRSPLFLATAYGRLDVCRYMLQKGADVHGSDGQEANLYIACEKANVPLIQLFIEHRADPWVRSGGLKTSAEVAVESGNLNLVQCTLRNDVGLDRRHVMGRTLLHCAARTFNADLIDWLFQQGYQVHAQDEEGRTAAHILCQELSNDFRSSLTACLQALYRFGDSFCEFDKFGNLPIHIAASNGLVSPLLSLGGRADAKSQKGQTPLHKLCGSEQYKLSELNALVDMGANVNAVDDAGKTPIMYTVGPAKIETVHHLVQHGAVVLQRDSRGLNTLDHVCRIPYERIKGTLENHTFFCRTFLEKVYLPSHGNINQGTKLGWTPLHYAALHARGDIVGLLLGLGADLDCRNSAGQTPLHLIGRTYFATQDAEEERALLNLVNQGSKEVVDAEHLETEDIQRSEAYQAMLSRGCDACVSDQEGNLPFFLAASTGWLNATYEILRAAATQGLF